MIGAQPLQGLLQLLYGDLLVSAVGANLAHQEHLIAPALYTKPHPFFAAVVVVLPCIVEKSNSLVHRFLNQANGQLARLHCPEMISAKADDRDLIARSSERPARNLVNAVVRHSYLLEVSGVVSGTNQGPPTWSNISVTSLCVWSKGNPWGIR